MPGSAAYPELQTAPGEWEVLDLYGARCQALLVVISLVLLSVFQFGCGGQQTATARATAPVGVISPQVLNNTNLVPTRAAVAFGTVLVGDSKTESVQLTNSGPSALTVSAARTSGPGFSINGLALPFDLAAGQTALLAVTFAPSSAGAAAGNVYFDNLAGTTLASVATSGTGINPEPHSVRIIWSASTSAADSYKVYRGSQSGGPYTNIASVLGGVTTATDTSVLSGQTYYYVVTALNGSIESARSSEVAAAIPVP